MLYIITLNGKPATIRMLDNFEGVKRSYVDGKAESLIAATTRRAAIRRYLYHFGFTWRERNHVPDATKKLKHGAGIQCEMYTRPTTKPLPDIT